MLFTSPTNSLNLQVKPELECAWENNPAKWVCANDFGAVAGDGKDDTLAIQKAIDAAAAAGKTTVYLRGVGGSDPNWYNLNGEVAVHGSVRLIIGLGSGRILGNKTMGKFIINKDSAPIVKFQHLDSFGGPPFMIENQSSTSTLVVESCGATVYGEGRGDIFMTDCSGHIELRKPGQSLWARQLNSEGTDDVGLVRNLGGNLWVLGSKFEGSGVRVRTSNRGRTELLGVFILDAPNLKEDDKRPAFDILESPFSIAAVREITYGRYPYNIKVRESRGDYTRAIERSREPGWIGWPLYTGYPVPKK